MVFLPRFGFRFDVMFQGTEFHLVHIGVLVLLLEAQIRGPHFQEKITGLTTWYERQPARFDIKRQEGAALPMVRNRTIILDDRKGSFTIAVKNSEDMVSVAET